MDPLLTVFLTAMTPVGELRAAIPLGINVFRLPEAAVYFTAVLGNLFPPLLILWLLPPFTRFLEREMPLLHRPLLRFFEWQKRRHSRLIELSQELGLLIFVALPLPMTGAWTGALLAWLFGLRLAPALTSIALGVIIAGALVLALSVGAARI